MEVPAAAVQVADPAQVAELKAHSDALVAELNQIRIQNEELFAQVRAQESSQTLEGQQKQTFKSLYTALHKARRIMTLFMTLLDTQQQHQQEQQAVFEDVSLGSKRKRTE